MKPEDNGQEYRGDPVTLVGDPTGAVRLYVYCHGPHLLTDTRPAALLDMVCERGLPLSADPPALTHILTSGVVPMPSGVFPALKGIGIGDRVTFRRTGAQWDVQHDVDFPYFAVRSCQDETPDPERLIGLLAGAVERQLQSVQDPVLMLSAGKDSTAIAAALARLGRHGVRCLTFVAGTDKDEDAYARALCRQLGLEHERVAIPADRPVDGDVLTAFFRNAPFPCGDDCQLPYVIALHQAGAADAVLDGSGNDVYMGHVPSRNDRRRDRWRVRNRRLAGAIEILVPFGTRMDQLLRDPVQHCFVQGLFRPRDVRRFFPDAVIDDTFKKPLLDAYDQLDVFDFRALVRGRHYDQGSCALKAQMACQAAGKKCLLPWCDAGVIDYYFNLPRSARFESKTFTNKVLLREMLRLEIGYPEKVLGKRYFQFDREAFFACNQPRIYDEILGCRYWQCAESERLLRDIYRRLPHNPRVGVALNTWFLLSGWLNHNRWLNR